MSYFDFRPPTASLRPALVRWLVDIEQKEADRLRLRKNNEECRAFPSTENPSDFFSLVSDKRCPTPLRQMVRRDMRFNDIPVLASGIMVTLYQVFHTPRTRQFVTDGHVVDGERITGVPTQQI